MKSRPVAAALAIVLIAVLGTQHFVIYHKGVTLVTKDRFTFSRPVVSTVQWELADVRSNISFATLALAREKSFVLPGGEVWKELLSEPEAPGEVDKMLQMMEEQGLAPDELHRLLRTGSDAALPERTGQVVSE